MGSWVKILTVLLFLCPLVIPISCERQKAAEPPAKTKANSPPTITSATILPERPNRENELSLIIQSNDADGDPVTYQYQWIKNGEDIVGESRSTLKVGNFGKGDTLQVNVTPSDGKAEGKPFLSNSVRVLNAVPMIQDVWIEPKTPTVRDSLKAHEKSVDADGDSISFTYQWEKNGVLLTDETKEVLEQGRFKKGDSVAVTIIPDDKEIMGTPSKSAPVIILNSAPSILSSPPFSAEGTKYTYQVKANDPDHDTITFVLKSGPKGMRIDQNTGSIQWDIQKEDKGSHSIEIEVHDNEGATSFQRYVLVIEVR